MKLLFFASFVFLFFLLFTMASSSFWEFEKYNAYCQENNYSYAVKNNGQYYCVNAFNRNVISAGILK